MSYGKDKSEKGSPEEAHNCEFASLTLKMVAIKQDATKRYGPEACFSLGSKGLYADINRKVQRIKRFVWDDKRETTSENVEDTLFDLAAYSLLMIMSLRREGVIKDEQE